MPTRLFLSQSLLDRWLSDGTADVSGDTLTIVAADHNFDIKTAVLFEKEVTESGDKHTLLGKVKDLDQIAELGGDYSAGTVIVGDEAYEVTDGFAGVAMQGDLLPALASLTPPPSTGRTTDPDLATSVSMTAPSAAGATSPGATSPGAASSAGSTAPGDLAAAIGSASGGPVAKVNELDLLARFFLEKH